MSALMRLDQLVGKINAVAKTTRKLGELGLIEDIDYGSTLPGPKVPRSSMLTTVQIVKADTSFTAPAGKSAIFKAGYYGTVVGAVGGANDIIHGFFDPFMSGDLAAGDYFLLFRAGPVDVIASAAISAGARIRAAASGKVVTITGTGDLSKPQCFGSLITAATADAQVRRAIVDCMSF